jgi:hypothetical protein
MPITLNGTTGKINNLTIPTESGTIVGTGSNFPLNIDPNAAANSVFISSAGKVFKSKVPYIQLLHNANQEYAAGNAITNWRVYQSRDIVHSSGVLTIPVTGLYHIGVTLIQDGDGGIYANINGTDQFRIGYADRGTDTSWSQLSGDAIFYMQANDLFKLTMQGTHNIYGDSGVPTVSSFYCYLIG